VSDSGISEGTPNTESTTVKAASVSSPAATGGAGSVFESSVGAYWLAQLLVGAIPPILIDCSVDQLHFQTEHLGWHTDDILVVGRSSGGAIRKLAGQIKRTFTISSSDEDCKDTILDFWADFKNPVLFSSATDRLAIITQLGTNTLLQHFGSLLECARAAQNAEDFEHRLSTAGFLSSTAIRYCGEVATIISGAEGRDVKAGEILPFLKIIQVLSLDLSTGTRQGEAAIKSLLSYTAVLDDKEDAARQTWNELLSIAAEAAPVAKSFTRANLPALLKQRHGMCGVEHPMLVALRQHSAMVVAGIGSTIGEGLHLQRAGLVQQALAALENSRVVVLSGPAGMGKSAVAKDVVNVLSSDHFSFSFRAEEFAQPHLDTTLTLGHIPGRAAILTSVLAGQQRKVVLIESVERLLEKSTRDAFADLLRMAGSDDTFRLILTCRDYSTDLVRAAFLRDINMGNEVIHVPPLTDVELSEVQTAHPGLALPLSSPNLRKILRNPYILDKALLINWSPILPLPKSEREFRDLFWREIVRADHRSGAGMPGRRDAAFSEIALRRARALSMYASAAGLDLDAVNSLRVDSLVVRSEKSEILIAPSHDVLEDWAILKWIDDRYAEFGGDFKKFSQVLGVHPALRRAFRKWIAELLESTPSAAEAFFRSAVQESGVPASFRDDTLVALLRSISAPALIENNRDELLSGDKQLLKRVLHLVRVGCVTTPAWLPGKAALFNVPEGSVWAALLSLIQSGWAEYDLDDSLLILGLIEDWAKTVSAQLPYPDGAPAAAALAYALLATFDDYSHAEERKRTLQVIAKIPNSNQDEFGALLLISPRSRQPRIRAAEELQQIVFAGPAYEGLPAARDVPEVLVAALRKHLLCREKDLRQERSWTVSIELEIHFGIKPHLSHGYFPASAYRTPMLPLLRQHPRIALEFIIGVFNHVAEWYAHPRVSDRLEPAFEVELRLPDSTLKKQWCNGRLWNLYRGTSVGPDVLQSYLMALERWLYELARQAPKRLDAILVDLLAKSDNSAIIAVVASVTTAFPFQCGESLLTLLTAREYVMMDRHRLATESRGVTEIFGNLLAHRNAENRLYQSERDEADKWPHRRQDLEFAITQLQFTHFAERVQKILDNHRQTIANLSVQNDDDRLWRLALHRMDLRGYTVAEDTAAPEDTHEKDYIRLELKAPESDLQEMVDRSGPQFARTQNRIGLLMWGLKVFKREIEPSGPDEWREKLRSGMAFENMATTDPMGDVSAGAPAIVAAVSVRDHWQDLSDDEKLWCVEQICSSVLATANTWNRMATVQRFEMSSDRACAWAMSVLITKNLPNKLQGRVKEAFVAALTHPVEEVSWYATWGASELWPNNRELACRSVYIIAMEARMIGSALAAENGKPYDARRQYEDIIAEVANRVRQLFLEGSALSEDAYDQLVIDDWHGVRAQNRILAILGKEPTEPLAGKAFARAAKALAQWWAQKNERSERGQRDYEAESSLARLIEQFAMRAPLDMAKATLQPFLQAVHNPPRELHDFIEGLLLVEDREPNTKQFWTIWTWFADRAKSASWLPHVDDRYSTGSEVINSLFLGTMWKEEVRHWRSLEGYAHHLHALFDELPPSSVLLDAYVRFLYHVGEQSLPEAFIRIAKKLISGDSRQFLGNSNTRFMLEVILQRYVYPKPLELKQKPELRDSVLSLLDLLVELGSSASFKMRDDFVTPVSS